MLWCTATVLELYSIAGMTENWKQAERPVISRLFSYTIIVSGQAETGLK